MEMKILWALVFVQFCVGGFLYGMVTSAIKRNAELKRELEALRSGMEQWWRIQSYQVASFGGTHSGEGQKRPYQ